MEEHAELRAGLDALRKTVQDMERRLSGVEHSLSHVSQAEDFEAPDPGARLEGRSDLPATDTRVESLAADDEGLEFRIGEFWLGEVGLVALLVGLAFLISFPFAGTTARTLQLISGYVAAGGLAVLSQRTAASLAFTSRILFVGSLILLYFSTLRLHFFAPDPLIGQKPVALLLLASVTGFSFWIAIRREKEHLAILACLLGFTTAICSDTTVFALLALASIAAVSLFLRAHIGWWRTTLLCAVLVYLTHLLWLFNNPLLGHPLQILRDDHGSLIFLFVVFALYGVADLRQSGDDEPTVYSVLLTLINSGGFCVLAGLVVLTYYRPGLTAASLLGAAAYLALASAWWLRRQSNFTTAVYACFGYVALSLAIVDHFASPVRFVWLGWQSLLVICTAIWYRNRIIVATNVIIYLGILTFYLLAEPPVLWVNLSYAAVGLLSARVMNWQQERLTLRTDALRNLYLASAFVIVPYGLYHGIPNNYVSLSWLGVAGLYFVLSTLLSNRKYRWMAILTILLTVIRVFAIDMANLDPAYRIVSFIVLGLAMLLVSSLYARFRGVGQER